MFHASGNSGHDDVAAISGIAGNGKAEGARLRFRDGGFFLVGGLRERAADRRGKRCKRKECRRKCKTPSHPYTSQCDRRREPLSREEASERNRETGEIVLS